MMNCDKYQSDYYTASKEDETDSEGEAVKVLDESVVKDKEGLRRSARIDLRNSTEEKVMRALKKLNVSYNPVMGGMAYVDDMAMLGGTDETYINPENFQEA